MTTHAVDQSRARARVALPVELHAPQVGGVAEAVWTLVRAAADMTAALHAACHHDDRVRTFAADANGRLVETSPEHTQALLSWNAATGWRSLLPSDDPRHGLLELYLPICSATPARPLTIAHLGQSLDGFIATRSGESQFVTGDDNVIHMHRLRALCDAIVVGAGTVAADNPQLTTRRVPGRSPVRVIVDPQRRLEADARVFVDEAAPTLYFCGRSRVAPDERHMGAATVVPIDERDDGTANVHEVLRELTARGCARVFIEGGGVTVSAFLEANLLDRLQITIAPVLIGDGRPAIRLTPPARLSECRRPNYRVFRMGSDILFDCDLRSEADATSSGPPILRVI